MMRAGLDMSTDGSRRRAGSCPPEGRMNSDNGTILGPGRALRGVGGNTASFGLGGLGATFAGTSGLSSQLSAGGPSNISARIVRTDGTNTTVENTTHSSSAASAAAPVPGTLQLTVLVPVLLDTPRRTEADVAHIGCNLTKGSFLEEESKQDEVSSLRHQVDSCNSCRICMRAFQEGEKLTVLPCAAGNCPSVWHESCVRKWLCQGESPTCPLCRTRMQCSAGKTPSGSAVAVEVRATMPLSTAMVMMAANSSTPGNTRPNVDGAASESFRGLGTAALNQLLRQLGQGIIQDILLLTLSQRSSFGFGTLAGNLQPMNVLPFFSNFPDLGSGASPSSNPAASTVGSRTGLLAGSDSASTTALADLGTLLLRSLHSNGNLPVTITAVETRATCNGTASGRADNGNPGTADPNGRGSNSGHGGRRHWKKRGKAARCQQRGSEETLPSERHQCARCEPRRQRGTWREHNEARHWTVEESSFAGLASSSGARASDQATSSRGSVQTGRETKQWRWVPVGSRESPVSHASSSDFRWSTDSPVSHASSSVASPVHPPARQSESSSDWPAETWGRQEGNERTWRRRGGGRREVPADNTWGRHAAHGHPQRKARWQRKDQ